MSESSAINAKPARRHLLKFKRPTALRGWVGIAPGERIFAPPILTRCHSPFTLCARSTNFRMNDAVATADFETTSAAGYYWDSVKGKWHGPPGAAQNKKGLPVIGAAAYAAHPSTRALTLSYKIPGQPRRRWQPGKTLPQDLFDWLARGGDFEAHNVMFERLVWTLVCVPRYGFPPLDPARLHCSAATARVNALPGALRNLGDVLGLSVRKNADGKRLLDKFSMPRNPTKKDPRIFVTLAEDPEDAELLFAYCDQDVDTERAAAAHPLMRPMTPAEREFWLEDQAINWRGIAIDRKGVRDCIVILDQALARYGDEFRALTGFDPTQLKETSGWLAAQSVFMDSMDADAVANALKRRDLPAPARRALEIRELTGSASVKKLYSLESRASPDNRVRDLIVHHGARTGRPTGEGPQPLNLPKAGPRLVTCARCAKPFHPKHSHCAWCMAPAVPGAKAQWKVGMVDAVLEIMADHSLELVEWFFGDALLAISGCIRGLFIADEGLELIASDYSAIEAVVIAMLAGQKWRIQAFRDKVDIYLASAARITGGSVEAYLAYEHEHGEHHPDRQKIGKVAELGLGFGGWIGAWRAFDDSDTFADSEVKEFIIAWREASPAIVELWGGQWRGLPWDTVNGRPERYGFEGAAVNAIEYPGQIFTHAGIAFEVRGAGQRPSTIDGADGEPTGLRVVDPTYAGTLIVTLLSGRELTYHEPMLSPATRDFSAPGALSISYMTWNSNPKYGPMGWVRMGTFGGRLTENIVQAIAHDILRFAILNLRNAGFPTVLHVYDEVLAEIPRGAPPAPGQPDLRLVRFELIMATLPSWALGWPVRAAGGWVGQRYRKV